MQNQGEPWACFLQLDGPIQGRWETVTPKACCLCPVYSIVSFWLLSLQETCFIKARRWRRKQAFQCFCGNLRIFHLDFIYLSTFLPATIFYFLSFKVTGNLHIDKAINSHNKNAPVRMAKVSIRFTVSMWYVTFYPMGAFSCASVGLGSILSGNISFSQTPFLIIDFCATSLGSVKKGGGACIKLAILLSPDAYSHNRRVLSASGKVSCHSFW